MRAKSFVVGVGLCLLLPGGSVRAHHSFSAEFDPSKPFRLKGVVTKMEWVNPHSWIHMDVKGPDGRVVTWMIEAGPPNALLRRGFTKNALLPGTEIVVDGFLAKDGSDRGNGRLLTYPDGKTLFLGSSGTGAPQDGHDPEQR
jgi:hypothetical protein